MRTTSEEKHFLVPGVCVWYGVQRSNSKRERRQDLLPLSGKQMFLVVDGQHDQSYTSKSQPDRGPVWKKITRMLLQQSRKLIYKKKKESGQEIQFKAESPPVFLRQNDGLGSVLVANRSFGPAWKSMHLLMEKEACCHHQKVGQVRISCSSEDNSESLLEIMQLEENKKEVTLLPQPKDYCNLKVGS